MNTKNILVENYFAKKKGDCQEILWSRYEEILSFHQDPLCAAFLAASYYSMEELHMRLPRINEILANPFGEGKLLHAITGLIMMADGGPAEGAKAIQIYLPLKAKGIPMEDERSRHLLALLAIACKQARPLVEQLNKSLEQGEAFEEAAIEWLKNAQEEQKTMREENTMAYALFVGMKDEVETIYEEL